MEGAAFSCAREKRVPGDHSREVAHPVYVKAKTHPVRGHAEHLLRPKAVRLSRWQTYEDSEKSLMLSEIGSVVRNRIMPPRRYHPEARLNEAEVNEIYQWTRADRRLLNHSPEKPEK